MYDGGLTGSNCSIYFPEEDQDLYRKVKALAAQLERSASYVIRDAIEQYLRTHAISRTTVEDCGAPPAESGFRRFLGARRDPN